MSTTTKTQTSHHQASTPTAPATLDGRLSDLEAAVQAVADSGPDVAAASAELDDAVGWLVDLVRGPSAEEVVNSVLDRRLAGEDIHAAEVWTALTRATLLPTLDTVLTSAVNARHQNLQAQRRLTESATAEDRLTELHQILTAPDGLVDTATEVLGLLGGVTTAEQAVEDDVVAPYRLWRRLVATYTALRVQQFRFTTVDMSGPDRGLPIVRTHGYVRRAWRFEPLAWRLAPQIPSGQVRMSSNAPDAPVTQWTMPEHALPDELDDDARLRFLATMPEAEAWVPTNAELNAEVAEFRRLVNLAMSGGQRAREERISARDDRTPEQQQRGTVLMPPEPVGVEHPTD